MKPLLDLFIFNYQLSRSLGVLGNTMLWGNYFATAALLRSVTPSFARMAAVEARLEGEYRGGVARAGREAEEIAFYDGGRTERDIIWRAYSKLMSHVNTIVKVRIAYEWTEGTSFSSLSHMKVCVRFRNTDVFDRCAGW